MVPDQTLPAHAHAEMCMQPIVFWLLKNAPFYKSAIGEDTMKTMKSSCVYLYGTFVTNEEEPAAGKINEGNQLKCSML